MKDTFPTIALLAAWGGLVTLGLGLTRTTSEEVESVAQPAETEDAAAFWNWLKEAEYQNWWPWPGQAGDFYAGSRPHGALLKMYVNRKVADKLRGPPPGSVIIKENYKPDNTLAAITVMRRVEGSNPEHGDWWWAKYSPEGAVAQQGGMELAGKVDSCIDCHRSADGGDYIFTNDGSEDGRFSLTEDD